MRLATLAAAGAALALVGCSSGTVRWDEPADYRFDVEFSGGDMPATSWAITVRDHAVAEVAPLAAEFGTEFELTVKSAPTLADLVADFNREYARDPECSTIAFDAATGAPSEIYLDWCSAPFDGGAFFTIESFTPEG